MSRKSNDLFSVEMVRQLQTTMTEEEALKMIRRMAIIAFGAVLLAASLAMAGEWDKKTTFTFSQPIDMPGFTLPAGTYVFVVADIPSSRHVIRVYNKDENHLYGTVLALPNLKLKATGKTDLRFAERTKGQPEAVRAWFFPGDSWGHEFVYPKKKAVELAQVTHTPVLAADVTPAEQPEEIVKAPVVAVTPENKEVEIAQVVQPPPQRTAEAPAAAPAPPEPAPKELPKTGSTTPLIALIGFVSLGFAGLLRFAVKRCES
jgi:LPXTG-motif cell wall-anchored protein